MASWSDKVEESVDSIVTEARITLDTGLFSENIIVLALDVTSNFAEPRKLVNMGNQPSVHDVTHVNSLSILSPKPGVSTIVKEMRTPSSSSSAGRNEHFAIREAAGLVYSPTLCGLILMPSSI